MLSIGEFSNICKVSTKTLRYYAEIGLLEPNEVYMTDPSQIADVKDNITEVYYPVKKITSKN